MPATTITTPFERVLDSLRGHGTVRQQAGGWMAVCPAHTDQQPSLAVSEGGDGRVLLYCHAGCATNDILTELNLTVADLFPPPSPNGHTAQAIVATYPYRDRDGVLLYEVLRLAPKGFRQRKPDGAGGWVWKLDKVTRVLYRLPDLVDAVVRGATVYLVEGEKDADRINNLGDPRLFATTASGGAGKWRTDYNQDLAGADVIIVADNDEPGRAHARYVAEQLTAVAHTVRVVVAAEGKDVSNHLDHGHQLTDLIPLDEATEPAVHEGRPERAPARVVQLADVKTEPVNWMWRGWLPAAKVIVVDGDPGLGKSTMLLDVAARLTTGASWPDGSPGTQPGNVVYLTAEDSLADTIRPRLIAAGADINRVCAIEGVGWDDDDLTGLALPNHVAQLADVAAERQARLVIIDPFMAFLGPDVNSHKDQDARRAMTPLTRLAEAQGCCIAIIRHLNKSTGGNVLYRGGGSIGIVGAVRVGWVVGPDPEDDTKRIVAMAKNNLHAMRGSLRFRIVTADAEGTETSRIEWLGDSPVNAADLANFTPEDAAERSEAAKWLHGYLSNEGGEADSQEVKKAGAKEGYQARKLERALDASTRMEWYRTETWPSKTIWRIITSPTVATVATLATSHDSRDKVGATVETGPATAETISGTVTPTLSPLSQVDATVATVATGQPTSAPAKPCPDCGQDLTGIWLTEHQRQCQPRQAEAPPPVTAATEMAVEQPQAALWAEQNPPGRTVADAVGTCQECGEPMAITDPGQTVHPGCEKE